MKIITDKYIIYLNGTASKFTRANKPVKIVYSKEYSAKSEAMKEEYRIKRLTRRQKEQLVKKEI